MLIYNIDYSAQPGAEENDPATIKIVKIAGYSSPDAANGAKAPKEGVTRMRAESAADLASLSEPILRALYAFKAKDGKVPEGMEDGALPEAVWATFEPAKKDRKKDLQSAPTDGTSLPTTTQEGQMAKAKKATKKAAKAKSTKSNGTRGVKSGEVKRLLLRKGGCTRKEILETTGWPTVSVQAMAKSAGLKLRVEKVKGKPMQYFGTEKGA